MKNKKLFLRKSKASILTLTLLSSISLLASASVFAAGNNDFVNQPLKRSVLNKALNSYHKAVSEGEVHNKNVITIVDFGMPSNERRMWVINPNTDQVLMNLHVAQGRNSGLKYATRFSNRPGSFESSLGAYVTGPVYYGKHGRSERVIGLDKGVNNNVMMRAIVIHPAPYVSPSFIRAENRAGLSLGCFAVNPAKSQQLINLVQGGSFMYADS